jgi:hypothetical protein
MSKKNEEEIDYFEDYQFIAIVSHLKDYTLCYNINLNLDFDLVKYDDLVVHSISETESSFTWYYFKDEISGTNYYLMGNKCGNGNLLKSQKTVDYVLLIKNPVSDDLLSPQLNSLRKISNVTAVFELDMEQQKNMDILLEKIELHELEVVNY